MTCQQNESGIPELWADIMNPVIGQVSRSYTSTGNPGGRLGSASVGRYPIVGCTSLGGSDCGRS